MGDGGGGRWSQAESLGDHHLRMARLRRMSAADLRVLFARPAETLAPWIESAARHGLAEAQLRLGQMRLDGVGGPPDPAAARLWFARAARQGSPEAMNMVGRAHENGWGTPVDEAAAARWYRRAAEAGSDWGRYNLANLLFDGRGVARDLPAAVEGYRRAAAQGHARAMNLLARCLEEGWGAPRDPDAAFDQYRRAAEAGYFRAQYNYAALLFERGRADEALALFETACRAAAPESRDGLVLGLVRHPDPRLAELGRRLAA
jgi:TPR repeat protein